VGLTGTKFGCGQALCGSCTVIVDKQAVRACITSVSDVRGRGGHTIEGLHPTGDHPVQKAWRQLNVPQCGFCQTGQIMQAAALLMDNPKPSHDQIRESLSAEYLPVRLLPAHRKRRPSRIDGGLHHEHSHQSQRSSVALSGTSKSTNVFTPQHPEGPRAGGGFVLAAPVMSRPGFAAYQTGADKMPHGTVVDPRVFVAIAPDALSRSFAHRAGLVRAKPGRDITGAAKTKPPASPRPFRMLRRETLSTLTYRSKPRSFLGLVRMFMIRPPSMRDGRRFRCAGSSRTGRYSRTGIRGSGRATVLDYPLTSAAACMIWPVWQKPHCGTLSCRQAFCTG